MDLKSIAHALGGEVSRRQVLCPGPGHSPKDRSLSVRFLNGDKFIIHSFAEQDWRECRDHVAALLGLEGGAPAPRPALVRVIASDEAQAKERIRFALGIWEQSVPLRGTLGCRYFAETRRLDVSCLEVDHCLRWHEGHGAIIALMTYPLNNAPTGVHRTYLNDDATKRERKMLGRQGVIRLSRDEDVTEGLGLAEGLEDGIAVLLSGWAPVWAATSCGAIERFPALSGIEALTIFHDDDEAGTKAARTCACAWIDAGRETRLSKIKDALR